MTNHTGAPIASDAESDDLANQSCLISAGPSDLVVLRALGKHTRMAKTIRRASDGRLLVEPHDGRRVYQVAHVRTLNFSNILQAGRGLATIAGDEFVVRGAIRASANPRRMRRLLHARPTCPATMAEVPRRYILFDVDGADVPIPFDPPNQVIEEEGAPHDPASLVLGRRRSRSSFVTLCPALFTASAAGGSSPPVWGSSPACIRGCCSSSIGQ